MPTVRSILTGAMAAATAAALLTAPAVALAQTEMVRPAEPPGGYGDARLPLAAVDGMIKLAARRAAATTSADGTHRVVLDQRVRVTLGGEEFEAARGVAWLKQDGDVFHVFAVLENVGSIRGKPGHSMEADRIPIRGVIRTSGVTLAADAMVERISGAWVAQSDAEFSGLLDELKGRSVERPAPEPAVMRIPRKGRGVTRDPQPRVEAARRDVETPGAQGQAAPARPAEPQSDRPESPETPAAALDADAGGTAPRIIDPRGTIAISPGSQVSFVTGQSENAVMATGGVIVQYSDDAAGRALDLSAQRVVIFLAKAADATDVFRLGASDVLGVYLEGDVRASDGRYTIRASRVYYDVRANRATLLDAVFWTYDQRRKLPLYIRAAEIRQLAAEEFVAERATLSTSAFFKPSMAIGARSVTISRGAAGPVSADPDDGGSPGADRFGVAAGATELDARGITLRAGGVPVMWLPGYKGDPAYLPLREVSVGNSSGTGPSLKSTWDLFALAKVKKAANTRSDLLLDWYFERGFAVGSEFAWSGATSSGSALAYAVLDDKGTDLFKSGTKTDRDGGARGIFLVEDRVKLDERWTAYLEGTYIGDEAFVDAYFERMGENRREFTTQAYLTRRDGVSRLSFQGKGSLNDFVANEYLLQSRGYSVSKLPEATYMRLGDDLIEDHPGLLQSFTEMRFGRLGMQFDSVKARERGFTRDNLSQRAFGINAGETIAARLREGGYLGDSVWRGDVRQEFMSTFSLGHVNVQPFVVGRFTAYDNDFDRLSPAEDDNARAWGSAGLRLSTTIQRIDETASSRLFDVRQIRHIVEPSVTLWTAGTTVDRVSLPVYDQNVEGITEGAAVRAGVNQTWQTKRGPGGGAVVDLFKLNTDVVVNSDDADRASPIRRFFESRPEQSQPGEFFVVDALWQTTDALAITGSSVYDLEINQQARTSGGAMLQHSPQHSSFIEGRFINSQDSTFLDLGTQYEFSRRYNVLLAASYNVKQEQIQTVSVEVQRRSQGLLVGFTTSYDTITGDTSFGFLVRPYGTRGDAGYRRLGFGAQPAGSFGELRGTGTGW